MLLREVDYARPKSLEEAVQLLSMRDNARPLAGGQSLINVMKVRVASPDLVVDLAGIPELREIRVTGGTLEIGAMVTYAELIDSEEARAARPILAEAVQTIADVQVRNRGTVGGNVCSNDPTNHLPQLRGRADGDRGRVLRGRVPDGRGAGRGADATERPEPAARRGRCLCLADGREGRHRDRERRGERPPERADRAGSRRDRLRRRDAGARHEIGAGARRCERRRGRGPRRGEGARGRARSALRRPRIGRLSPASRRGARGPR